jgi:transcriptional regulator with XRE-family HTH domain
MPITPAQCRAARGLVEMDQGTLADDAMVSRSVIIDFEKGRRVPTRNNLAAIQRVLEEAGVEFTNGDAPGVRLRKNNNRPPNPTNRPALATKQSSSTFALVLDCFVVLAMTLRNVVCSSLDRRSYGKMNA